MESACSSKSCWAETTATSEDDNFRSDRQELAHLFRHKHRNANASMTVRVRLHAPTAVNRDARMDVIRVVEKAERTDAHSVYFPLHLEPPARRVRTMNFAVVHV